MSNPMRRRNKSTTIPSTPPPEKGPLARIAELETGAQMLMTIATRQQANIERLERILEAIETILDPQLVQKTVADIANRRASEELALGLAEGRYVVDHAMHEGCLITMRQEIPQPEGEPVYTPAGHVPFDRLLPDIKAALLGQGVNARHEIKDGVAIIVDAIYRVVPQGEEKPPAVEETPAIEPVDETAHEAEGAQ